MQGMRVAEWTFKHFLLPLDPKGDRYQERFDTQDLEDSGP